MVPNGRQEALERHGLVEIPDGIELTLSGLQRASRRALDLRALGDPEAASALARPEGVWRPAVDRAPLWERDVWVDLGLLTFARAIATLRDGRLISKREALDLLPTLGAPAEVVEDVRRRRYGGPGEQVPYRAELTRLFLGPAIDDLVAAYG